MTTLAAICLNEEQFLATWLGYHYHSFDRIVICEGAARDYPGHAVTRDGLSIDGTARIIQTFPDPLGKIQYVQYGWAGPRHSTDDRVPAKIELRNAYAELLGDGLVFTLDIDEFLHPTFVRDLKWMMDENPETAAFAIPQLHLWQTPRQYITGGYADVPHFRLYRWREGSRYVETHNWPSGPGGVLLVNGGARSPLQVEDGRLAAPAIVHFGFCESTEATRDKNAYYLARGEEQTRPATTLFRAAALSGSVPAGCVVRPYRGFLPYSGQ